MKGPDRLKKMWYRYWAEVYGCLYFIIPRSFISYEAGQALETVGELN